jgi:hypothetical protein
VGVHRELSDDIVGDQTASDRTIVNSRDRDWNVLRFAWERVPLGKPVGDTGVGGTTVDQSKGLNRSATRKSEANRNEEMIWRIEVRKGSKNKTRRNIILRNITPIRRMNERRLRGENRTCPNVGTREP